MNFFPSYIKTYFIISLINYTINLQVLYFQ